MYVEVRNWSTYQHYKERNPPWIKLQTKLLDDDEMRGLAVSTRLLAVLLLCVAARRGNRIPADVGWLSVEVGMPRRVLAKALADLLAIGYIKRASGSAMPRDRERDRDRYRDISKSSNGYLLPERALGKLLLALVDKDTHTERTIRKIARTYRLAEGDFMWALECATGPGVVSPSGVAVAELKKRGETRRGTA